MFKLQPNPTFWAPIDVPVPGGEPQRFEVLFRHKTREQLAEFGDRLANRPAIESVLEVVADWRGIDAEFSADTVRNLDQNYLHAVDSILHAYWDEFSRAKRKN